MNIGKTIKIETYPERSEPVRKPEGEPIYVPNWPVRTNEPIYVPNYPVREPVTVPSKR
jgi:hypothetical protein